MKISSEWTLIDKLRDTIANNGIKKPGAIICDIGDDCSAFTINEHKYGLITTDIAIENQHFKREISSPEEIGAKAMCANISDIAAMGGSPLFAFVSIGIPGDIDEEYILNLYRAMTKKASESGIYIAGGDTSKSELLILNIALYGEIKQENLVTRSGARVGDKIYLTGTTGDSKAGLEILLANKSDYKNLINNHLNPDHRLNIVDFILKEFKPTSMIDISDGIISDLNHICQNSSKGFLINQENLPVSDDLKQYAHSNKENILDYSLSSGEEYELLFTSDKNIDNIEIKNIPITQIGEIVEKGYFLKNNDGIKEIEIKGFNHFT